MKPKSKDESDEEEAAMFNPFKDPDPIKTFTYRFPRPLVHKFEDEEFIEIKIRGYKSDADEVWQSTGVTLWRAATFLCEFMLKHFDLFQNKTVLEVRTLHFQLELLSFLKRFTDNMVQLFTYCPL